MTTPPAHDVELRPITVMEQNPLASKLWVMIYRNKKRLQLDFPQIVNKRYATLAAARKSVANNVSAMLTSPERFGAYVPIIDDQERGLVSYLVNTLYMRSLPFVWRKYAIVTGPLLAGWLDDWGRSNYEREILPVLLQKGEQILADQTTVQGHPYTFVRPGHTYVRRIIETTSYFGGFIATGSPRYYSHVDGVRVRRQLYIARLPLAELRKQRKGQQ